MFLRAVIGATIMMILFAVQVAPVTEPKQPFSMSTIMGTFIIGPNTVGACNGLHSHPVGAVIKSGFNVSFTSELGQIFIVQPIRYQGECFDYGRFQTELEPGNYTMRVAPVFGISRVGSFSTTNCWPRPFSVASTCVQLLRILEPELPLPLEITVVPFNTTFVNISINTGFQ